MKSSLTKRFFYWICRWSIMFLIGGFFIMRSVLSVEPIFNSRMLLYFANSYLFDDLFFDDQLGAAALAIELANIQLVNRLDLISYYFSQVFNTWNTGAYLFITPRDLSSIVRDAFTGLILLLPHLDMAAWLKLWLVTLQPIMPWGLLYSVYSHNMLSVDYVNYIQHGLWYCSMVSAEIPLTAYDTAMAYNTLIWILVSVTDVTQLSIVAPLVSPSNIINFI